MNVKRLNTSGRTLGGSIAVLLVAAALGPIAPLAPAAEDPAASMYQPGTVDVVNLTLSPAATAALEAEPDEYVEGEFSLSPTEGTPGTEKAPLTAPLVVGVRLKGNVLGSFEPLTGKAGFKIKFNEFVSGQKFLGLKKMTLNNMVEDPSMVHETLTYSAFRAAGVPAPRTGFAYLRVNGDDYGVYLNIETLDDVALKKLFGSFDDETQHLYEGEDGADVVPGDATAFEVDEGDEEDLSDLEALIEAASSVGSPSWSTRMAPFADLQEMTRMWALDKYTGRWDGYAGSKEGPDQPNNYYLYSDPLGRFQMLPWGSDETWEDRLSFDGDAGFLFNRCLADSDCAALYWESLGAVRATIAGLGLDSLAVKTAELLKPWQAIDPRKHTSEGEIKAAVSEVRGFIASRSGEAGEWLAAHAPPVPPSSPNSSPSDSSSSGAGSSTTPAKSISTGSPPTPAAHFLGVSASGRSLTTRVRVLAAARVTQRARLVTRDGDIDVCAAHVRSTHAGTLTLHCRLSRVIRKRLSSRWLRPTIITRVITDDGETEITRQVKLPRT